jgi:hypothetical protein
VGSRAHSNTEPKPRSESESGREGVAASSAALYARKQASKQAASRPPPPPSQPHFLDTSLLSISVPPLVRLFTPAGIFPFPLGFGGAANSCLSYPSTHSLLYYTPTPTNRAPSLPGSRLIQLQRPHQLSNSCCVALPGRHDPFSSKRCPRRPIHLASRLRTASPRELDSPAPSRNPSFVSAAASARSR